MRHLALLPADVKRALYEPIGMWLPKHLITPGTSTYVQGVGYTKITVTLYLKVMS